MISCFKYDATMESLRTLILAKKMEDLQLCGLSVSNAIAARGTPNKAQRVVPTSSQASVQPSSSGSSGSSHVGRMRQLQRGALGGGARASQAPSQALSHSQPPKAIMGAQGMDQAPAQSAAQQHVAGGGVALKNESTTSFGSATPSTSSADAQGSATAAASLAAMARPASVLQWQPQRGKPKGMKRANQWTPEVENLFRFQLAGFQDVHEYVEFLAAMYGAEPQPIEVWPESGFIRSLQNKNSNFMYFRKTRECVDKFLNKVKIYSY